MNFRLASRTRRSQPELQADSGTVRYELSMLLALPQRYAEAEMLKDAEGMNMAVESFALHCRALILFLYGHWEWIEGPGGQQHHFAKAKPNDIFAWDYCPGWEHSCPVPPQALAEDKWRADKHVAHIVTERRGVNQPGTGIESRWPLGMAVQHIAGAMAHFLSIAPAGNFYSVELLRMQAMLSPWTGSSSSVRGAPVIAKSGPLDDPLAPKLQARTDARTVSPHSGIWPHGKTE